MDCSQYEGYYLLKCFSKEEYRDQFNNGNKMYINSVGWFHEHGDTFQRDFEGGIFQQPENSKGKLIYTKGNQSVEQIIEKYKANQFDTADLTFDTEGFKIFLNGYICCFALFSKSRIAFSNNGIVFSSSDADIQKEFYDFLNGSAASNGYTFLSVYDAKPTLHVLGKGLLDRGYGICYGPVNYCPLTEKQRIDNAQKGDIAKIVFSKDSRFAYQKEFRIFIQSRQRLDATDHSSIENNDHLEIKGIDLRSSVILSSAYLTRSYLKEHNIEL